MSGINNLFHNLRLAAIPEEYCDECFFRQDINVLLYILDFAEGEIEEQGCRHGSG